MYADMLIAEGLVFENRKFKIYEEKQIWADPEHTQCVHCSKVDTVMVLIIFHQMGFVVDIFIACCRCSSCGKEFAVRDVVPPSLDAGQGSQLIAAIPKRPTNLTEALKNS